MSAAVLSRKSGASARETADLLKLASDATRLRAVVMLRDGERSAGQIVAEMGLSQPAVSHHLSRLRLAGVVEKRRVGKNNFYRLTSLGERLTRFVESVGG